MTCFCRFQCSLFECCKCVCMYVYAHHFYSIEINCTNILLDTISFFSSCYSLHSPRLYVILVQTEINTKQNLKQQFKEKEKKRTYRNYCTHITRNIVPRHPDKNESMCVSNKRMMTLIKFKNQVNVCPCVCFSLLLANKRLLLLLCVCASISNTFISYLPFRKLLLIIEVKIKR